MQVAITRNLTPTNLLLALTVAIAVLAMPLSIVMGKRPEPGEVALVIAPPWTSVGGAAGVVRAAGGQEIGPMRAPFAVLAILEAPEAALRHGAWLILDGRVLAMICGVSLQNNGIGSNRA